MPRRDDSSSLEFHFGPIAPLLSKRDGNFPRVRSNFTRLFFFFFFFPSSYSPSPSLFLYSSNDIGADEIYRRDGPLIKLDLYQKETRRKGKLIPLFILLSVVSPLPDQSWSPRGTRNGGQWRLTGWLADSEKRLSHLARLAEAPNGVGRAGLGQA